MHVDGELSESFPIGARVRQECVMSPWLFNIFMVGCMREMKAKVRNIGGGMPVFKKLKFSESDG